jgi:Mg-chelatase subunit ChlD
MLAWSMLAAAAIGCQEPPLAAAKEPVRKVEATRPVAPAASAAPAAVNKPAERPRVEAVFVLDTTGSMSGLIQAAKEKIWSIANTLASAKPAPDVKIGLVAYRDRGDSYVTKVTPLGADLDLMYRELMKFEAGGGGDGPESVNQALHEAVTTIGWSKDAKTYRVIFLVGDYPPHMDYQDDVKYQTTCERAAKAGITINAIQCGDFPETTPFWTDIATRAEGRFFKVEQSGGAILASTPFDGKLAELAGKLDGTRVYYGGKAVRRELKDRDLKDSAEIKNAPVAAQAQRAKYNVSEAGRDNFSRGALLGGGGMAGAMKPGEKAGELVQDLADKKLKLAELKAEEMPEELKKLSPAELEKALAAKAAEREKLQKEIRELSEKRQRHLADEAKKQGKKPLESHLFDCIKEQGGRRGLSYGGGPDL